jgi:hypothetical protein
LGFSGRVAFFFSACKLPSEGRSGGSGAGRQAGGCGTAGGCNGDAGRGAGKGKGKEVGKMGGREMGWSLRRGLVLGLRRMVMERERDGGFLDGGNRGGYYCYSNVN